VWSDVNDDNRAQATEEVGPGGRSFIFPFTNFNSVDGPSLLRSLQVQLGLGARQLVAVTTASRTRCRSSTT
jgi:hypothetical protein